MHHRSSLTFFFSHGWSTRLMIMMANDCLCYVNCGWHLIVSAAVRGNKIGVPRFRMFNRYGPKHQWFFRRFCTWHFSEGQGLLRQSHRDPPRWVARSACYRKTVVVGKLLVSRRSCLSASYLTRVPILDELHATACFTLSWLFHPAWTVIWVIMVLTHIILDDNSSSVDNWYNF